MPLRIKPDLSGAMDWFLTPSNAATSPERCVPSPSSASARRYSFSRGGGALHCIDVDGRRRSGVPYLISPLLDEVRIAARDLHQSIERRVGDRDALSGQRVAQRIARIVHGERPDRRVLEQPLGIGLRTAGETHELRQTGSDQRHRRLSLRQPMHRHDQRAHLGLIKVLDLVDDDSDCATAVLGGLPDREEEIGKIGFEIARVRSSLLRIDVETHLDVADLQPAPGENGLLTGSIYRKFINLKDKLS